MTLIDKFSRNNLLRLFGIVYGRKAFAPPREVELILLRNCNLNCVVCETHSDFVKKHPRKWKLVKQDFKLLSDIIHELSDFGVEKVVVNAHGEPFLYPSIIRLVELIKEEGMQCHVITNGTTITKGVIKKLSKSGIDLLRVSLWAGDAKTYIKVHPNQTEKTFYKIKKWMLYLKKLKEDTPSVYPRISIVNVILNRNYDNITKMIDFAQETGAYSVEFRVAYLSPPGLNRFSLSKEQRISIISLLDSLKGSFVKVNNNLKEFQKEVSYDWKIAQRMDRGIPFKIPCYIGWFFSRIDVRGDVRPCSGGRYMSIGNIYEESFKRVWFSHEYNRFRKLAKQQSKGEYFKDFTCDTNCCNFRLNLSIHNYLHPWKRI